MFGLSQWDAGDFSWDFWKETLGLFHWTWNCHDLRLKLFWLSASRKGESQREGTTEEVELKDRAKLDHGHVRRHQLKSRLWNQIVWVWIALPFTVRITQDKLLLCLSFLICKMGIIIIATHRVIVRIRWVVWNAENSTLHLVWTIQVFVTIWALCPAKPEIRPSSQFFSSKNNIVSFCN